MSHRSGKKKLEHNSSVSSERFSTSLVLIVGRGVTAAYSPEPQCWAWQEAPLRCSICSAGAVRGSASAPRASAAASREEASSSGKQGGGEQGGGRIEETRERKGIERRKREGLIEKLAPHPRGVHVSKTALQNCWMTKCERF